MNIFKYSSITLIKFFALYTFSTQCATVPESHINEHKNNNILALDKSTQLINIANKITNDKIHEKNKQKDILPPQFKACCEYKNIVEYPEYTDKYPDDFEARKKLIKNCLNDEDKTLIIAFVHAITNSQLFRTQHLKIFLNELVYTCLRITEEAVDSMNIVAFNEITKVNKQPDLHDTHSMRTSVSTCKDQLPDSLKNSILENILTAQSTNIETHKIQLAAKLYVKSCKIITNLLKLQIFNTITCIIMKRLPGFITFINENTEENCIKYFRQWQFKQSINPTVVHKNHLWSFYDRIIHDLNNDKETVDVEELKKIMLNEIDDSNFEFFRNLVSIKNGQVIRKMIVINEQLQNNDLSAVNEKEINKVGLNSNTTLEQSMEKIAIPTDLNLTGKSIGRSQEQDNNHKEVINETKCTKPHGEKNISKKEHNIYDDIIQDYESIFNELSNLEQNNAFHSVEDADNGIQHIFELLVKYNDKIQKQRKKSSNANSHNDNYAIKTLIDRTFKLYKESNDKNNIFNRYLEMCIVNSEKTQEMMCILLTNKHKEEKQLAIKLLLDVFFYSTQYFNDIFIVTIMKSECDNAEPKNIEVVLDLLTIRYKSEVKKLIKSFDNIENAELRNACIKYVKIDENSITELLNDQKYHVSLNSYNNILIYFTRSQLLLLYNFYILYRM